MAALLPAALLLAATSAAGCRTEQGREAFDHAVTDRSALQEVVAADVELDQKLGEADRVSAAHDSSGAADLLEQEALPKAEAALAKARALSVGSTWGQARKDEWVSILSGRREEIPRYAAALRSDDPEKKLGALQAQVELQKRAMAAAAAVEAGPTSP